MPDPTVDTRERLLDAADVLMHERGYEAVGVAELCRVAEAKKGSFYFFFESKQALALAMLDRSWQRTQNTLFAASLTDPDGGGLASIDRYGQLLAEMQHRIAERNGVVVGCRFGNFATELSTRDEVVRARVDAIFDEMVELAGQAIVRAVDLGEVDASTDVARAATELVTHMEGLMVMAKTRRDPDILRGLGGAMRRLLG